MFAADASSLTTESSTKNRKEAVDLPHRVNSKGKGKGKGTGIGKGTDKGRWYNVL